jgi:hypothetical protein
LERQKGSPPQRGSTDENFLKKQELQLPQPQQQALPQGVKVLKSDEHARFRSFQKLLNLQKAKQ